MEASIKSSPQTDTSPSSTFKKSAKVQKVSEKRHEKSKPSVLNDVTSPTKKNGETSPTKRSSETSPTKKSAETFLTSPKKKSAETLTKKSVETSTKKSVETFTKKSAEISTKKNAEISTKKSAEISTKKNAETSIKKSAETRRVNTNPQEKVEPSEKTITRPKRVVKTNPSKDDTDVVLSKMQLRLLEQGYHRKKSDFPSDQNIQALSRQLHLSKEFIMNWFVLRHCQEAQEANAENVTNSSKLETEEEDDDEVEVLDEKEDNKEDDGETFEPFTEKQEAYLETLYKKHPYPTDDIYTKIETYWNLPKKALVHWFKMQRKKDKSARNKKTSSKSPRTVKAAHSPLSEDIKQ